MKHYLPVFAVLGGVLMLFALTMAVPLAFAWLGHDAGLAAYLNAIAVTFTCGALLFFACRGRAGRELQPRDGFLLVTLVWTVLPAFGALPLMFHIQGLSFTDAYFEAVSGLTTTGATVLTPVDDPRLESRLLERIWNGEIDFHIPSGRVVRRSTGIDRRVVGFSGQESSVRYKASLEERIVTAPPEDR